jgi:glycosyltransferase involved in cell wall biosynthesis
MSDFHATSTHVFGGGKCTSGVVRTACERGTQYLRNDYTAELAPLMGTPTLLRTDVVDDLASAAQHPRVVLSPYLSMRSSTPSVRAAMFMNIIAHYRQALLRELENIPALDLHLFADHGTVIQSIPVLDLAAHEKFRVTRCRQTFGLTWQSGAVTEAAVGRFEVYVFMGDASWLSTWIAAGIARARGRRVLFWTHGWTRRDRGLKRLVRLMFYRLATGLLLYGEHAKRIGIDSGFDPRRLHVMFNSLDFDQQQALRAGISDANVKSTRRQLFGVDDAPVVLATARLTPVKRFDLLIRACAEAQKSRPNLRLLIVGDGPEKPALERLAIECAVPTAFVGNCYDEATLARYFASANVTVSPGNVGLTCMHSMGYGVPVITHGDAEQQMPEFEAIVPGITGALVRKDCVEALAAAIVAWTDTSGVSQRTREACLAVIRERYHPRAQAQVLSDAMQGPAARTPQHPLVA